MDNSAELSEAEVARIIDEEWQKILRESGFTWSPGEVRELFEHIELSPETTVAKGIKLGAAIGLSSGGKTAGQTVAPSIKTREQLDRFLQELKQQGDRMPTMFRQGVKEVNRLLPRRGGPGRHHKLTLKEATLMCDCIAEIRRHQKVSDKESLEIASKKSPQILGGKKIGARTLWDVWDNRDKLASVYEDEPTSE